MKNLGLLAEFKTPSSLLEAARKTREAGFDIVDAYTPYPIEELDQILEIRHDRVAPIALVGGILSGLAGFFMQWYANVVDYPINIGGRPLNSWPSFVPVTFELTILGSALSAAIGMILLNRLPKLSQPLFFVPGFSRASNDSFFLHVGFDPEQEKSIRNLLKGLGSLRIETVSDLTEGSP